MRSVLIKPGDAVRMPATAMPLDIRDIGAAARQMLAEARAEADRIRTDARRQAAAELLAAQSARVAAEAQGRAEGQARGVEEARQAALESARAEFHDEAERTVADLRRALADVATQRHRIFAEAQRDVIVLALAVADRVVNRVAEFDPHVAVETAAAALGTIRAAGEVALAVHSADAERIARYVPQWLPSDSSNVRVVEDESVERGGVRLETRTGAVDATLSAQIDRIAQELVQDWRSRRDELLPDATVVAADAAHGIDA